MNQPKYRFGSQTPDWLNCGIKSLVLLLVLFGLCFTTQADDASDFPPYTKPYVDVDEWRDSPVRHRYVHGGFKDTEARFSIYFPPKEQYQGRFFQPLQAVSGNENTAPMALYRANGVGFAIDSGGYMVESNQGARNMFGGDSKANAAVAQYSRTLAAEMYGPHRPFGYVYGGSGGAFKTLGCVENHPGVWDGSIPFVHGSPVAIPHVFTVQAHAMRVLKDKFPQIVDAIEPGGSGDMYAGLNAEEKEALAEVTGMGFPPRAWFNVEKIAFGYTGVFTTLVDMVRLGDPSYFDDFWTQPGYLGANPTDSLKKARIQQGAKISTLVMPDEARNLGLPLSMPASQINSGVEFPAAFRINNLPDGDLQGATITMNSGGAKDSVLYIVGVIDDVVLIGFGVGSFQAMAKIREGDEITIDNSVYLASQTFHRHQIQTPDFYVWDQFKNADGRPAHPQRAKFQSPQSGGSTMSGNFDGKMIVLSAMMDEAAFPWQADWFRSKVKTELGDEFNNRYRLYYIDNTMHTTQLAKPGDPRPVATTRVVSYQGALQQALRDLSNWVEKGIEPPAGTNYKVVDGQIIIPDVANERHGIQPVVTLTVGGGDRAIAKVGESVELSALIEMPAAAGKIIKAEWDFEGAGEYPRTEKFDSSMENKKVTVKTSYTFSEPGTYFPVLRVASEKDGNVDAEYALVENLGRVRVVVQ